MIAQKVLPPFKNWPRLQGLYLTIKTYDSFQKYGIIIIDKDTENALVKVEQYNFDNPNTRRNKIAYKVDNPDFYESSLSEYNELLEKSKEYVC